MEDFTITQVTHKDIDQLQKIGKQTFYETFAADNSEADMTTYLNEGFSIQKLIQELNDSNTEFYFVTLNDSVVGYLKINLAQSQTELKTENALEIERIYILNEYQGKKVGQLLFDKAIQIARVNKVSFVWLGVWEKNIRAINFYKKNGFVEFDKHIFKLGEDEQIDLMMKLELKASN
jgi:diamine N-acetyltransferase